MENESSKSHPEAADEENKPAKKQPPPPTVRTDGLKGESTDGEHKD